MDVAGFLRWWRDQLTDWIPERIRARLTASGRALLIEPHQQGWKIRAQQAGNAVELGSTVTDTAEALRRALADQPTPSRIELTVPPGQYLSRTLDLPLAAADDLAEAIGYQIDTLTPFKREQVWLFCGEQQRLPDGKRLRAWLVAVPRRMDMVFDQLGLSVDARPLRGPRTLPDPQTPVTLAFRPANRTGALPLGWLLVGINLIVLMIAASLHLDNRESQLTALKQQARELQPAALAAGDLNRQVQTLQRQLDTLQARHDDHLPRVALLDEVTARLDDQTWVHRLELRQQQLRLQGSSTNASALIGQLDASPLINDVRFEASLTRDPAGGERFNLAGTLAKPAADHAVAEARP